MRVQVFDLADRFSDPEDFRAGVALFFSQVETKEITAALSGAAQGEARNISEIFMGEDNRWRLLRPLPRSDDPDALVVQPAQVQYLIQPPAKALFSSLILVGLPENGKIAYPALAGTLSPAAAAQAGQLFTIEPEDPDRCSMSPVGAAEHAQDILERHLPKIK